MCSRKASQLNEPKVRVRVTRCTQHLLRRPYCTQHHAAPKEVATVEPVSTAGIEPPIITARLDCEK